MILCVAPFSIRIQRFKGKEKIEPQRREVRKGFNFFWNKNGSFQKYPCPDGQYRAEEQKIRRSEIFSAIISLQRVFNVQ
jgi:hypothetical protein